MVICALNAAWRAMLLMNYADYTIYVNQRSASILQTLNSDKKSYYLANGVICFCRLGKTRSSFSTRNRLASLQKCGSEEKKSHNDSSGIPHPCHTKPSLVSINLFFSLWKNRNFDVSPLTDRAQKKLSASSSSLRVL